MKKRWLLAGIASCALTACFPARMTEQPGFVLEVRDRSTGAALPNAQVHFVKVRMALRPKTEMREFRTDENGQVRFDRKTEWQWIVGIPDLNHSWEWYLCVDEPGYLPFAHNGLMARPPSRLLVELESTKSEKRCAWRPFPLGFN